MNVDVAHALGYPPELRQLVEHLFEPDACATVLLQQTAEQGGHRVRSVTAVMSCDCGFSVPRDEPWYAQRMVEHKQAVGAELLAGVGFLPPGSGELSAAYLATRPLMTNSELATLLQGVLS